MMIFNIGDTVLVGGFFCDSYEKYIVIKEINFNTSLSIKASRVLLIENVINFNDKFYLADVSEK